MVPRDLHTARHAEDIGYVVTVDTHNCQFWPTRRLQILRQHRAHNAAPPASPGMVSASCKLHAAGYFSDTGSTECYRSTALLAAEGGQQLDDPSIPQPTTQAEFAPAIGGQDITSDQLHQDCCEPLVSSPYPCYSTACVPAEAAEERLFEPGGILVLPGAHYRTSQYLCATKSDSTESTPHRCGSLA